VAATFRSASAASNTGGTLAVSKPSGLTAGDLMVAWHYADNDGVLSSMGAPSGWGLLGSSAGTSGGHPYVKVWTKVATSTDVAASTFSFTDSASGIFNSVVILAVTAGTYDPTTPTTAVSFNNGGTSSSSSVVAPSVTGVVDGLLCTSHGQDTGGTAATFTAPSGMTERADTNSGSGSYTALEVATLALASTSATGTKTATSSTSRPWKGASLIVNPFVAPPAAGGLRTNLSTNPACGTNATGWTGPSGWARSTSVDAALPRATGFEGTVAGDVTTPLAQVTSGEQYFWAVWVKAVVDQAATMQVSYYSNVGGTTFVGNSGAAVALSMTAGDVTRFVLGPYTVPSTAVSGQLKISSLDGAAEFTAHQVELADSFDLYFDGASPGAEWSGTAQNSTSTVRQSLDTVAVGETFSIVASSTGPTPWTDTATVGESFAISATGAGLADSARVRDGFLISSLEWDPGRGRNRVSAFTFDFAVVTARVSRRRVRDGGVWETVRGGEVPVVNGRMVRPADDYEFPSGIDLDYRIEGVTVTGAVLATATIRRQSVADSVWLKFIAQPSLNLPLTFMGRTEVSRPSRTAVFDVQGRPDPVVVSDVHSSRRMSIRCKTETPAETAKLDHALSQGLPCYLQVPETINTPSLYAMIGDYQHEAPAIKSMRSVFTIPLIEVAAPAATIVSPGETWQNLLDNYGTWELVMAGNPTWLGIAD
jgi:hypothetical protein